MTIYFWTTFSIYLGSQTLETMAYCVKPLWLESDAIVQPIFMIKALIIIFGSMVLNMLITCRVLPKMRKNLGCSSITVMAYFMLIVFEVIMLFRLFIILTQADMKDHAIKDPDDDPDSSEELNDQFKIVMIIYFTCCEMVLYGFLIVEIIH